MDIYDVVRVCCLIQKDVDLELRGFSRSQFSHFTKVSQLGTSKLPQIPKVASLTDSKSLEVIGDDWQILFKLICLQMSC